MQTDISKMLIQLYNNLEEVRIENKILATKHIPENMNIDRRSASVVRRRMRKGLINTELRSILVYMYAIEKELGKKREVILPVTPIDARYKGNIGPITVKFKDIIKLRKETMNGVMFSKLLGYKDGIYLYNKEGQWKSLKAFPEYGYFIRYCSFLKVDMVSFTFEEIEQLMVNLSRKWDMERRKKKC